jgi:hypothetical protein
MQVVTVETRHGGFIGVNLEVKATQKVTDEPRIIALKVADVQGSVQGPVILGYVMDLA